MNNPKANLFIVGAAKSGTTSLYRYLREHPEIYMSRIKEPHHFSSAEHPDLKMYGLPSDNLEYHSRMIKKPDEYSQLIEPGKDAIYRGEASPSYLYDKRTAEKIYNYNKHARILIILRHPVDRAISHFKMTGRQGMAYSRNLMDVLKYDETVSDKRWNGQASLILELGYYTDQINRYFEFFQRQQVKIVTFEDLISDPFPVVSDICIWLDLKPDIHPEVFRKQHNPSSGFTMYSSKIKAVSGAEGVIRKIKQRVPGLVEYVKRGLSHLQPDVIIPEEAMHYLKEKYRPETDRLNSSYGIHYTIE